MAVSFVALSCTSLAFASAVDAAAIAFLAASMELSTISRVT